MGQPVKILDLAERMIQLSGLEPGRDIKIVFTGLRPGERLHEILFDRDETNSEIGIAGILAAKPVQHSMQSIIEWLDRMEQSIANEDRQGIHQVLREAVPDFRSNSH
jgi:O-antigen biosynthesis protein WbqV